MTSRLTNAVAAGAFAALLPLAARAIEYGGGLGFRYDRSETWTPTVHALVPRLQVNGDLAVRGAVVDPEVLRWDGNLRYEGIRGSYSGSDDSSDGLTYRLALGAFQKRNSLFTATASASRSRTDFSVEAPAGSSGTGVTITNDYGVGAALGLPGRPSLSVGLDRRESSNSGFGRTVTEEKADELDVGLRHATGPYTLAGNYAGTWNEGTLSLANYVFHSLALDTTASLFPSATLYGTTAHRQRIPTTDDPLNPRTESNSVITRAEWKPSGAFTASADYSYFHNIADAPALETRESASHSMTAGVDRQLSTHWSGAASLGAQLLDAREGPEDLLSGGQSAALLARWRGLLFGVPDVIIEAGPKVGLLEPAGGGVETGHGATGRARLAWQAVAARYGLDYLIDYESNLSARQGWILRQQLSADLDAPGPRGVRLRAYLTAMGLRQTLRPFGGNASRSVNFTGTASLDDYSLRLDLALGDGLQQTIAQSIQGDGLFFPESYDAHSRMAALSADVRLRPWISFTAIGRYATQSGAGTPTGREASVAGVVYSYLGLFRLAVEDRYIAGGAGSLDQRTNVFSVTLTRSFGGRL